jgi:imidazolonepropionase-like amidohydrolase
VLGHYILAAAGKRIIESGFTTVRDVGSHDDEASALKLAVDMGIVPGPRILTCGRIVSATAPGGVIFRSMYREADGPCTSANELLRLAEAGLSLVEALRAATIGGAAALGRSDLGRISVGATADLVVVNGRPDVELGLLTQPSSIVEVMRSGAAVG